MEATPEPLPAAPPAATAEPVPSSMRERLLRKPVPGPLYTWVRVVSWVELGLFAALLFFWLSPGFEHETFIFGLGHGIGFLVLCGVMWIAALRREIPYPLLAATMTPAGPVGSVIGIYLIDRHGLGIAKDRAGR